MSTDQTITLLADAYRDEVQSIIDSLDTAAGNIDLSPIAGVRTALIKLRDEPRSLVGTEHPAGEAGGADVGTVPSLKRVLASFIDGNCPGVVEIDLHAAGEPDAWFVSRECVFFYDAEGAEVDAHTAWSSVAAHVKGLVKDYVGVAGNGAVLSYDHKQSTLTLV